MTPAGFNSPMYALIKTDFCHINPTQIAAQMVTLTNLFGKVITLLSVSAGLYYRETLQKQ